MTNPNKYNIPLYKLIIQWFNGVLPSPGSFGEIRLNVFKWTLNISDGISWFPVNTDIDHVLRASKVAKSNNYNDLDNIPKLNFQPYDDDLTAIAQLVGAGLLRKTAPNTWELDTTEYVSGSPWTAEIQSLYNQLTPLIAEKQDGNANLTAIAQLAGSGFLKKTGAGTWVFDNSTYLTAITKAMVEAVLTGEITSHSHAASEGDHKVAFHDNQNLVGYLNSAYYNITGGVITPKHDDSKADLNGDIYQQFSAHHLVFPEGWTIEVSSTTFTIKKSGNTMFSVDQNKQVLAGELDRGL